MRVLNIVVNQNSNYDVYSYIISDENLANAVIKNAEDKFIEIIESFGIKKLNESDKKRYLSDQLFSDTIYTGISYTDVIDVALSYSIIE